MALYIIIFFSASIAVGSLVAYLVALHPSAVQHGHCFYPVGHFKSHGIVI